MITVQTMKEEQAAEFLALCTRLDHETKFMMLEPGERQETVAGQRERIRAVLARDNETILVAECDGELAGYVSATGGTYRRDRSTAYVVLGVRQAFAGQGVGTALLAALEAWAREHQIHRLELTVMAHNERAVALYKKMGYEVEGTKRDSLLVDGAYVDEIYMARILD